MSKLHFKPETQTGTLSEKDSKKYFSTVGLAVFVFMLLSYGSAMLISFLLLKFAPEWYENIAVQSGLSMVAQYGIGFPAALAILSRLPKDTNPSEKLGVKGFFGFLCIAFTFMTVGSTIADATTGLVELLSGRQLVNPVVTMTSGTSFWINLVFMAILAPIIEELVFRKVICDRLLPLGEGYAIVLSGAIFGLVHGNLFQFFYAFLTGMLFSYVYVKTGRLRYTVIYHMIINFLGGVLLPWAIDRLSPVLTEEMMARLSEVMQSGDTAAMEALSAELTPYMVPVAILSGYEILFTALSIAGVFVLFRGLKNVKFREGLLPPDKESRIANVFCNAGVATAIAGFALIFVISLV